ncbi:MAG: zf-HC2 domain-containing protein [Solirubrobacterales bacterium]|nr:zf-HC2 domain-containing protein [Solirubrobacterales bacterium]
MASTLNPVKRHREHCRHVRALMSDYLDGELPPPDTRTVKRHVRWCPNCRRMLKNLTDTVRALHALGLDPTTTDGPGA